MKKIILFLSVSLLFIAGCSTSMDNSVTIKNLASGDVMVNFRAQILKVPAGQTLVVKDIPKGAYTYATTYEIPANAESGTIEGSASGTMTIKPGTKVTILYTSVLTGTDYTVYATISSSDSQTASSGSTNP